MCPTRTRTSHGGQRVGVANAHPAAARAATAMHAAALRRSRVASRSIRATSSVEPTAHDEPPPLRRPVVVAPDVTRHLSVADLDDPVRDAIQEVAIVRDHDHRAVEPLQRRLEDLHALDVQVVRRLVEEQAVRAAEHQQAELQPRPLAARQRADRLAHLLVAEQEPSEQRDGVLLVHRLRVADELDRREVRRLGLVPLRQVAEHDGWARPIAPPRSAPSVPRAPCRARSCPPRSRRSRRRARRA